MGSDITHDDTEEPLGEHLATDGEENVEVTLPTAPPGQDTENARSEELAAIRESLETLRDVQTVMNDRLELLGREVDDIWMALRDDR